MENLNKALQDLLLSLKEINQKNQELIKALSEVLDGAEYQTLVHAEELPEHDCGRLSGQACQFCADWFANKAK